VAKSKAKPTIAAYFHRGADAGHGVKAEAEPKGCKRLKTANSQKDPLPAAGSSKQFEYDD
jgi:hypothetical protein